MTQLESIQKAAQTAEMLRDEIHQARKLACKNNPLLELHLEVHHRAAVELQKAIERIAEVLK